MMTPQAIRTVRPRSRRRAGSVLMEAALVMPLLLMILMSGIEFGMAFYVKHCLLNAARDGARRGIVGGADTAAIKLAATDSMKASGLSKTKFDVFVYNSATGATVEASTLKPGDGLRVEVRSAWSQYSVFLSSFRVIKGNLNAATTMRREG